MYEVWYQEQGNKARHFVTRQQEPFDEDDIKMGIAFTPKGYDFVLIEYGEKEITETIWEIER